MAGGILVPQPGITLAPPAVQAGSLNHRAVREVCPEAVPAQGQVLNMFILHIRE